MEIALMFLSRLAPVAVLFLIYRQFAGRTFLSETAESWIARASVNVIALAIVLYASEALDQKAWLWLAPVVPLATVVHVSRDRLARIYRKKTGKTSFGDGWVCKKCGAENGEIMALCVECEGERS